MGLTHLHRGLLLTAGLLLGSAAAAQSIDRVFGHGLESTDTPANNEEAARFLNQATFGPDSASIARVRSLGYSAWIAEQRALPVTLQRPTVEALTDAQFAGTGVNQSRRMDRWFFTAVYAQDQLRMRVAWALSQIFVVSDRADNLGGDPDNLAEFYDILARNAFGSYRTLLEQVSYSPAMSKYLSSLRNRAQYSTGNPPTIVFPDENYAREIMQLFSIGLIRRNQDFTPMLVGGLTQPTYDQDVISNMAKVFTGLNYPSRTNFGGYSPDANSPETYTPLQCMTTATGVTGPVHDQTAKTIFDGIVMPAGQSCAADFTLVHNHLNNHSNVGPFIARQLIQRLVTSNPTPAYIGRVAAVFNNNGSGVRGDLGATVRAILLDAEARQPATGASAYGKTREPLMKLIAFWRAFNAVAPANLLDNGLAYTPMGVRNPEGTFLQRPLGAPTVFNFYEPDFQQPGALDAAEVFSPELQIINEVTIVNVANTLRTWAFRFVGMTSPPTDAPLVDYSALVPLAGNATALVDALNARLMAGQMTVNTRQALISFLGNASITGMTANNKIAEVVNLLLVSPEFGTQK